MAFDFNTANDNDSMMDKHALMDIKIFLMPIMPTVLKLLDINEPLKGFKTEVNNTTEMNMYYKQIVNPNIGQINEIKNMTNLKKWTYFDYQDFVYNKQAINDTCGEHFVSRIAKLVPDTRRDRMYISVSPDKGLAFLIYSNKDVSWRSFICAFVYTGQVDYDIPTENNKKKKETVKNDDAVKTIAKIAKQYLGKVKISLMSFKPVDIPGTRMAIVNVGQYKTDAYREKISRRHILTLTNYADFKKLVSNWSRVGANEKLPDFCLNFSKGNIEFPCWSKQAGYYDKINGLNSIYVPSKRVNDLFSWCDYLEDGTLYWYIALTDEFEHFSNGKILVMDD